VDVWSEIARARTSSGDELLLRHRDDVYEIRCNGWDLMSNRAHASEEALARFALSRVVKPVPRILIGGLGMGFTLRAALDASPPDARIEVVELLPEIVAWNQGPLASLNRRPLEDRRATVHIGDVANMLTINVASYDAIILDIDNGPDAVMYECNAALYSPEGLGMTRKALVPRGVLALWSANRSVAFEALIDDAKASWRVVETPAQSGRATPMHAIYLIEEAA
jgi:spermidine synthase